ncbi:MULTISPECIES: nucleotide exchange factor GrpE [unclassified Solwaraspora]|uniref:nucleotide exchange factor GrpE n=1 Tax=unclassified Solwaraspora TaxID=2627926 RepID=UPI00259B55CC|nr:nucleotide exchange factor GrpE [Solwaraspora sp. WMMA2056]WJK41624.1 nucleotide exchange factor GrpE [Solwaraspora sp. WMMA2056]
MTDTPRAADPAGTGRPAGRSRSTGRAEGEAPERLVIRDRRRIDPTGTRTRSARHAAAEPADAATATDQRPAGRHARPGPEEETVSGNANGSPADSSAEPAAEPTDQPQESGSGPATRPDPTDAATVDEPVTGEIVEADEAPDTGQPAASAGDAAPPLGAELQALRADLDERTRDLQRVTAEYANYRKRVERDKGLASEQATGAVLAALLPILDDLDRAREHGDLVGPFGTVAEQLTTALGKFGLTPFGEKGDPFDPTRHEAVAHLTSGEVTEPTCVDVMRRGYLLGDRLLRAALVAVADPE